MQRILVFMVIWLVAVPVYSQEKNPPFWEDIQKFKAADQKDFPPQEAILFVGSSTFTMWKTVQEDFPDHQIINRGFGGSTFVDLLRYKEEIIFPYRPKQVVIYEGDNDAAASDTISATTILNRFKELYHAIRTELPDTYISFVSIKPSPSRTEYFPVMEKANWEIQTFLKDKENTSYIDLWHRMLDDFGQPKKELFREDMLHMKRGGYELWQAVIAPYLLD